MSSRSASFGTLWVFLGVIRARIGNGRSWQDSSRRLSTPRPCADYEERTLWVAPTLGICLWAFVHKTKAFLIYKYVAVSQYV